MQAVSAEFSGYAGKFRCFLERRVSNSLFRFVYFKTGFYADAKRLLKSFLDRNELVASAFA
jgi:hypothetical protein